MTASNARRQSGEGQSIPIACTLDDQAAFERLGRWAAIRESHRIDRQLTADGLVMRFRLDVAAERELGELVAAERDCCGFVDWHLETTAGELVLRVTGDSDGVGAITL